MAIAVGACWGAYAAMVAAVIQSKARMSPDVRRGKFSIIASQIGGRLPDGRVKQEFKKQIDAALADIEKFTDRDVTDEA